MIIRLTNGACKRVFSKCAPQLYTSQISVELGIGFDLDQVPIPRRKNHALHDYNLGPNHIWLIETWLDWFWREPNFVLFLMSMAKYLGIGGRQSCDNAAVDHSAEPFIIICTLDSPFTRLSLMCANCFSTATYRSVLWPMILVNYQI